MMNGKKTYVAAGLAILGAVFAYMGGNVDSAAQLFVTGLGMAGLRNAIANK